MAYRTSWFERKTLWRCWNSQNQALVLVNYGSATGKEILEVSEIVQDTVFKTFGIAIETEVNII